MQNTLLNLTKVKGERHVFDHKKLPVWKRDLWKKLTTIQEKISCDAKRGII